MLVRATVWPLLTGPIIKVKVKTLNTTLSWNLRNCYHFVQREHLIMKLYFSILTYICTQNKFCQASIVIPMRVMQAYFWFTLFLWRCPLPVLPWRIELPWVTTRVQYVCWFIDQWQRLKTILCFHILIFLQPPRWCIVTAYKLIHS